jgi:hypothetical protein
MDNIPPELRDSEGYRSHDKLVPEYGRLRKDGREELELWNNIREDSRRVDACMVRRIARGLLYACFCDAHILLRTPR